MLIAGFLTLLVVSNAGVFLYAPRNKIYAVAYDTDMAFAFQAMRGMSGRRFILIIGDSITYHSKSRLPETVCGLPLIPVGVGTARSATFLAFAQEVGALQTTPALTVIALGVNDTPAAYRGSFKVIFPLLLDSLHSARIALVNIAPNEYNDKLGITFINGAIREFATDRGLLLIDMSKADPFETVDGVHPGEAAKGVWSAIIVEGIKKSIGC